MAIVESPPEPILAPGFDLVELLLAEQRDLSAVERFSQRHERLSGPLMEPTYRELIPLSEPGPGEQYAFEVDLDACSGCKACVVACHNMNGLEEDETWRRVGLLQGVEEHFPAVQHVTTACHHCVDPGCLKGCPVQAYEKDPVTGVVIHLDDQCIGCKYCTLMCPYDVPKYSEAKGIVRKCDMCRHRLADGEAPACVQSCPNSAIRIRVVDQDEIRAESVTGAFLRGAADPRTTNPTTRYVGKNRLEPQMHSAGLQEVALNHTHLPLVGLLTLTQAALGMLLASLAALVALNGGAFSATLAVFAAMIGLAASGAHLGRPMYGFRVFLGLRTSWLSREAVLMPAFAGPLVGYAVAFYVPMLEPWRLPFGLAAVGGGLVTIFCSAMIYVVTRRPFWQAKFTFGKFAATITLVGLAAYLLDSAWNTGGVAVSIAAMLPLATATRLGLERRFLKYAAGPLSEPLARSARLLQGPLAGWAWARTWLWTIGGIALPLGLLLTRGPAAVAGACAALAAILAAELLDRALYFAAESTPPMPTLPR